jgi:hypothetical protein
MGTMTMTMTNDNLTLRAAIDEVAHDLDNIKSAADQALAFLGEIRDPQDYNEPTPAAAALSLAWDDAATIVATIQEVISGMRTVRRLLSSPPSEPGEEVDIDSLWSGPPYAVVPHTKKAA